MVDIRSAASFGEPALAWRHYEAALALKPGFKIAHFNLGMLLTSPAYRDHVAARHHLSIAADGEDCFFWSLVELAKLEVRIIRK